MGEITRRDFIAGAAAGVAAAAFLPRNLQAEQAHTRIPAISGDLPPARTGLRGSHDGSFEVFHEMSWRGNRRWPRPDEHLDSTYDVVVVGAGISGLAAAWFYRRQAGPDAKILILDNHDDFGGHARRNEFEVDGRTLLAVGGSTSITFPDLYSRAGLDLLDEIGVRWGRFFRWWGFLRGYYDFGWFGRHGTQYEGIFFDGAKFEKELLARDPLALSALEMSNEEIAQLIDRLPLRTETRKRLIEIVTDEPQIYPGLSDDGRRKRLSEITYEDYLRKELGLPDDGILLLRKQTSVLAVGVGWDALAADVAAAYHMPGLRGIKMMRPKSNVPISGQPFVYTYPDGNATIARLLVRSLVPAVAPGIRQLDADVMTARFRYEKLDDPSSPVRVRLSSMVVNVQHTEDQSAVDVTYVNGGVAYRVRGRHVVLANWNQTVPYMCPELEEPQKAALASQQKAPMAFVNVALRNWRAIARAGYVAVTCPECFYDFFAVAAPVSVGGYRFPASPDEPIVLGAFHFPTAPGRGLDMREQMRVARYSLLDLPFEKYETRLVEQLDAIWGRFGFDPDSIAAITVNRWPHGYAPTWNSLFDPGEDRNATDTPQAIARARIGRISIANSDSEGQPTAQAAIDAAHRAVNEQLEMA